jgi:hypothetical protein
MWQMGSLYARLSPIKGFLSLYFKIGLMAAFPKKKLINLLKGFLRFKNINL